MEVRSTYEATRRVIPAMRKLGLRILPGGDYGFAWNPIGRNARDLELLVRDYGFTPGETLHAVTALGAQLMHRGGELGLIKEGYIADLLLVAGNPVDDITILQEADKLTMVMKGGTVHKAPANHAHA
ncbi:amidohydrolase family protein [Novosphingobium pentaromativorans]|uniref:Putative X-Pro dipeptidase n=1 Tax=Novosphingobium pentaromativorans US6-1 TaxID=1088721 RepID=G6EFL6_9SPHN|nr:amidohydrolase family protein [Novosphingobium pentaromativorans]EHJ59887.1 Putative X-Pro dipeptidase [Novosphingobium pentaromativorans US6-1]